MARILVTEDNEGMRLMLHQAFSEKGHQVESVVSAEEALELLKEEPFDLVVTDLRLPRMNGVELLKAIKRLTPGTMVMVITAHGTVESAVEAMQHGAFDYLQKPFPLGEMEVKVEKALAQQQMLASYSFLREQLRTDFGQIVGKSPPMQAVYRLIEKVGPTSTPVLLHGESGTGKELVAREIHEKSLQPERPFVPVNCAALAEGVLESELFGHEKGAFTGAIAQKRGRFEIAEGGTIFLDEIAELSPKLQAKLLRAIQEKEIERVGGTRTTKVDARVIAATNRDLQQALNDGSFREDLYYRVGVIRVFLPPLHERKEDIPLLVDHFLARYNQEVHKSLTLEPGVLDYLMAYDWPGNIRELENVVERAVVLAEGKTIRVEDLPQEIRGGPPDSTPPLTPPGPTHLQEHIDQVERQLIRQALDRHHWNQTRTARELGLKRSSLQYKMKKLGLLTPPEV